MCPSWHADALRNFYEAGSELKICEPVKWEKKPTIFKFTVVQLTGYFFKMGDLLN